MVVGEAAASGSQVREGGLVAEVGHTRGVDVGVLFDLAREQALVVAGTHERSPDCVPQPARAFGQWGDLLVEPHGLPGHRVEVTRFFASLTGHPELRLAAVDLDLVSHHRHQAGLVFGELDGVHDLGFEFTSDQRCPPAQRVLGDVDVAEQVVADIEDLSARNAQGVLDQTCVASEVDIAPLELATVGSHQAVLLIDDAIQLVTLGEEAGLARRDNDDVEEVTPRRTFCAIGVDRVAHHEPGVVPVRVGNQQEPLPCGALIAQRLANFGIGLEERVRVVHDLGLQRTCNVRFVERRVNRAVELGVGPHPRQWIRVVDRHQLTPQRGTRKLKQRIHELKPVFAEIDHGLGIGPSLILECQELGAVTGSHDIPKSRCLHQVAELKVERQTQRERIGIEYETVDRPAEIRQAFAGMTKRRCLPRADVVVQQRVVHVVADGPNRAEVERPVRKDAAFGCWVVLLNRHPHSFPRDKIWLVTDGPTPHLEGTRGDYAPTVLLPGDPKRARFIADNYLDDARQVNAVRGADGFTGTFDGRPVSVQSVGMGIPSAAIYYTELIRFFGCERLIRVGSCGGLSEDLQLGDVIAATAAGTNSAAVAAIHGGLTLPAVADWAMLRGVVEAAEALDIEMSVGPVFTSDLFYSDADDMIAVLQRHGVLGLEMEIAGLYAIAAAEGAKAVALLTVSDDLIGGAVLSAKDREDTFANMVRVALAIA